MSPWTTAAQDARAIRARIKEELGFTSRMVSVRSERYSGGSSVSIRIRSAPALAPGRSAYEAIASDYRRIRYCQATGDILSGGNRYIDVEAIDEAFEDAARELVGPLTEAAEAAVEGHYGYYEVEGYEYSGWRLRVAWDPAYRAYPVVWYKGSKGITDRLWGPITNATEAQLEKAAIAALRALFWAR